MILGQKLLNTLTQLLVPWLPEERLGIRNVKRIQITCNLKETNNFLLLCCSINNPYSLLIGTTSIASQRKYWGDGGSKTELHPSAQGYRRAQTQWWRSCSDWLSAGRQQLDITHSQTLGNCAPRSFFLAHT